MLTQTHCGDPLNQPPGKFFKFMINKTELKLTLWPHHFLDFFSRWNRNGYLKQWALEKEGKEKQFFCGRIENFRPLPVFIDPYSGFDPCTGFEPPPPPPSRRGLTLIAGSKK